MHYMNQFQYTLFPLIFAYFWNVKWIYIMENWSFLSDKHRMMICAVIAIMVSNRHYFLLFLPFFFFAMMDETWLTDVLLPCSVKTVSSCQKGSKKSFESLHRRIFSLLVLQLVSDRKLWSDYILELFYFIWFSQSFLSIFIKDKNK